MKQRTSKNSFFSLLHRARVDVMAVLAFVMSVLFTHAVLAQTPEQIDQLRQLSPAQKSQLVEYLGETSPVSVEPSNDAPRSPTDDNKRMPDLEEDLQDEERIGPGSWIVVDLAAPQNFRSGFESLDAAIGRRTYQIGSDGALNFPVVGKVPLAGLTPPQAQLRLSSEELLEDVSVAVFLLPVQKTGLQALEHFGYRLFRNGPDSFESVVDIPIPRDYVVGPGDVVNIAYFGNENAQYRLRIGRDGQLMIPGVGPISVTGMTFDTLREEVTTRLSTHFIGVNVSVSLDELRSMRVFVLGDVERPGSYTVSSLSTISNALFNSGGIALNGSLRNIQLKRSGKLIKRLDLYDLLLHGNNGGDVRLMPGDVIFIPTVGDRVSVAGQVKRPAIYEIRQSRTVKEVIDLAGGLLPSALAANVQIKRFNADGRSTIVSTNIASMATETVQPGDEIFVQDGLPDLQTAVLLKGHVLREGPQEWYPGMRVSDLVGDATNLKPQADLNYALIRRESGESRKVQLISVNIAQLLADRSSTQNIRMVKGDRLFVFSIASDRAALIEPWLNEVRRQSSLKTPAPDVGIGGEIRAPGTYPLEPGMRISDLVRAAGHLKENAYTGSAELTRYEVLDDDSRETYHVVVNLESALAGDAGADRLLQPYDFVTIKEVPQWEQRRSISLIGEVQFPGTYPIRRGERLSSVIRRAGGLTDLAFTAGSVFLREDLREREEKQLRTLADRLEREITALDVDRRDARSRAEALLDQLTNTEAQGRLVLDLDAALMGPENTNFDVLLKDGDRLLIPSQSQEVTVIGEVQYSTSHVFEPGLSRRDYIDKSGGLTANADRRRIYVVRANGNVLSQSRSGWFRGANGSASIQSGDTIVVPLEADRVSKLSLWTSVSQVIYNIGVAAAAVASF